MSRAQAASSGVGNSDGDGDSSIERDARVTERQTSPRDETYQSSPGDADTLSAQPPSATTSRTAAAHFSQDNSARTRRRLLRRTPRRRLATLRGLRRSLTTTSPPASATAASDESVAVAGRELDSSVDEHAAVYDLGRHTASEYDVTRLADHVSTYEVADPTIPPGANFDATRKCVRRQHGALSARAPVSPPVVPAHEALCRRWIEQRLDARLCDDLPLVSALRNGVVLNLLLGEPAEDPEAETLPMEAVERNLQNFFSVARRHGLRAKDLFDIDDLVLQRNVPRVIRTVAAVARSTDADRFSRCAAEVHDGTGARPAILWGEHDELDETWAGHEMLLKMAEAVKRARSRRRVRMLVAGAMGSGKSATIDRLVGRRTATQRHNVTLRLDDEEIREAALRAKKEDERWQEREQAQEQRQRPQQQQQQQQQEEHDVAAARRSHEQTLQRLHPIRPYENAPGPGHAVETHYAKVAGVVFEITELPSMERYLADDEDGLNVWGFSGRRRDVVERVRRAAFDVVLLVERLDHLRPRTRAAMLEHLQRTFGAAIWERTIVVFTHGYSLPPEGLTFEENLARRVHLMREALCRTCGRDNMSAPVSVVENSDSCPVGDSGACVLPNGTAFMARLGALCENIVARSEDRAPLVRTRAGALRRWRWRHVVLGTILFAALQLLVKRRQREQQEPPPLPDDDDDDDDEGSHEGGGGGGDGGEKNAAGDGGDTKQEEQAQTSHGQ